MMHKKRVKWMAGRSAIPGSTARRMLALAAGAMVFLWLIPWALLAAAQALVGGWPSLLPRGLEIIFGILCILDGICIVFWAVATLWRAGRGTPNPMVPTQRLVVSGPYQHCRNPIQLGALFYYLGIGSLQDSILVGLTMFLGALALATLYHKCIEEKELSQRFGQAYEDYRRRTPFLVPRWRRKT